MKLSSFMSTLTPSSTEHQSIEAPAKKVWTDAEFMALSRDGHRYEIVDGELIDIGNSGAKHGYIAIILSSEAPPTFISAPVAHFSSLPKMGG